MKNILFINACVRPDSRTKQLATYALSFMQGNITEVDLNKAAISPLNQSLLSKREDLLKNQQLQDPMFQYARQFASADSIVVAAPFWDLSFPSALKAYLEQITISGITFFYTEKGYPQGLCKAKELLYISTAGGPIINEDFGYGYVKTLCNLFFGIKNTHFIKAEGLDIIGADIEKILNDTKAHIRRLLTEK